MQGHCSVVVREIGAATLHQLLDSPKEAPLLIDVRQPQEFVQGHIPGALLIPLGQLELPHPALTDRSRPIVLYCRSGKRSMAGANILCNKGFEQIMSLKDGILGWPYATLAGPPRDVFAPAETTTAKDILLHAMGKEIRAHKFYGEWLSQTDETALKTLLQELASREEGHMVAIYERYFAWCEANAVIPLNNAEFKQEATFSLEDTGNAGEQFFPTPSSREDLLELAVEKEWEAYNFYKTSAEIMPSIELRELLLALSFEERVHATSLLNLMA